MALEAQEKEALREAHAVLKNHCHNAAMKVIGDILEEDEQARIRRQIRQIRPDSTGSLDDSGNEVYKYWLWASSTSGAQYRHHSGHWWVRLLGEPKSPEEPWQPTVPLHHLYAHHGELFIPITYLGG